MLDEMQAKQKLTFVLEALLTFNRSELADTDTIVNASVDYMDRPGTQCPDTREDWHYVL